MIIYNCNTYGITINNHHYKISQFTDGTTLFLDGTKDSLEAALNTLEIFGSLSGLVVNKDKTKLIWLGKKKRSSDMYNICENLVWGATEFDLLGIHFTVDLENITTLNFMPILTKCEKILNQWKRRRLTPLGRITVVKTFILSSFNHIFSSLPYPNAPLIKKLNSLVYSFVWDNKPDKINRKLITNSYGNGGLNMVDIDIFIKCQKIAWVKRLIQNSKAPWANLFSSLISTEKFYLLGPFWAKIIAGKMSNPFWREVLLDWSILLHKTDTTNFEPLTCPIWYNPQISSEPIFYSHWYKAGIIIPLDLLNHDGKIKTLDEIKLNFNIKSNFLEYFRIKSCLSRYLSTCDVNMLLPRPFLPPMLKILLSKNKGCRQFYNIMHKDVLNLTTRNKWCANLNIDLNENDWKDVYKICFKTLPRNDLTWFQYRIIHRILGTKSYLKKLNISATSTCNLCSLSDQTLIHLFTTCSVVTEFWKNLKNWLSQKFNLYLEINPQSIMFGVLDKDIDFFPKNCIILVAKKFIFESAKNSKTINLARFIPYLELIYFDHEYISKINGTTEKFQAKWSLFNILKT